MILPWFWLGFDAKPLDMMMDWWTWDDKGSNTSVLEGFPSEEEEEIWWWREGKCSAKLGEEEEEF